MFSTVSLKYFPSNPLGCCHPRLAHCHLKEAAGVPELSFLLPCCCGMPFCPVLILTARVYGGLYDCFV